MNKKKIGRNILLITDLNGSNVYSFLHEIQMFKLLGLINQTKFDWQAK